MTMTTLGQMQVPTLEVKYLVNAENFKPILYSDPSFIYSCKSLKFGKKPQNDSLVLKHRGVSLCRYGTGTVFSLIITVPAVNSPMLATIGSY